MAIERGGDRIEIGEVLAVLFTLGVGAALVPLRGGVDNSVTALVLAAAVSLSGALAGWRAGLAGAVAAAVAFNFFHTQPYGSLRIHDADDVLTTATLVVVGAIAGVTSSVAHRRQERVVATAGELLAIERISDLVADGAAPADVATAVRAELLGLLGLSACTLETRPSTATTLGRHGVLPEATLTYRDGGFELPATGVCIPVRSGGEVAGYLCCTPTPGVAVSIERRRAAVTLADLLGASLRARPAEHTAN